MNRRSLGRPTAGCFAVVTLMLAGTASHAAPTDPQDLSELLTDLNGRAGDCIANFSTASEELADADLASAATAISSCISTIDDAITTIQNARDHDPPFISAAGAANLILQYKLARLRLENPTFKNGTLDYINATLQADGVNTSATGVKARSKSEIVTNLTNSAMPRHEATLRHVNQRLNPGQPRLMLAADRPSLHNPGSTVCWRVLGVPVADRKKDAASCPISVQGINPAGNMNLQAIAGGPMSTAPFAVTLVAPSTNPCSGRICFQLAGDMGGGDIQVFYNNGVTNDKVAERILFNRGDGNPDPFTGLPTIGMLSGAAQFAGSYSGGYVGNFTYTGNEDLCGQPPGTVEGQAGGAAFTVSTTGSMTVTAPGPGGGSVTGLGGYSTGSLSVAGGTSRFVGSIMTNRLNNAATARGTWTFSNSCGKGSGTWLATR